MLAAMRESLERDTGELRVRSSFGKVLPAPRPPCDGSSQQWLHIFVAFSYRGRNGGRMPNHKMYSSENSPAATMLGREVVSVDTQAGAITLRYVARHDFANRHGTVLGGFLAAMLDSATGMALMSCLPPEMTAVTTRLDVSFVSPAGLGPILAAARIVRQDARSAEVEAELMNESGDLLAKAKAELRIVRRRH